jgi:hypothetical protein
MNYQLTNSFYKIILLKDIAIMDVSKNEDERADILNQNYFVITISLEEI